MLEIIALVITFGAYQEAAQRRGVKGWPFIIVGLVGYIFFSRLGAELMEPGAAPFFGFGFLALLYGSIYIIGGGGRSMPDTWQCPDCRAYNPPSTIVCPCGYDPAGLQPHES